MNHWIPAFAGMTSAPEVGLRKGGPSIWGFIRAIRVIRGSIERGAKMCLRHGFRIPAPRFRGDMLLFAGMTGAPAEKLGSDRGRKGEQLFSGASVAAKIKRTRVCELFFVLQQISALMLTGSRNPGGK